MAGIVTEENLKDRWLGRRRKIFLTALSAAVVAHLIFGVFSAVWIVSRYFAKSEATFVSKPPPKIPPQIMDPKLQAAEFEAAARKPVLDQKLSSIKPMDFALPDVPRSPVAELVEIDPNAIFTPSVTGMTGQEGGSGAGGGGGGGGIGSMEFFGVKTKGNKFVFVIDISGSMVNRKVDNFEPIVQEVTQALAKLTPDQQFGLVLFAGDDRPYRRQLTRAGTGSMEAALKFLDRYNPGNHAKNEIAKAKSGSDPWKNMWKKTPFQGTRADLALERAFKMRPDVIVFLSDGDPTFDTSEQPLLTFKDLNGDRVKIDTEAAIHAYVAALQKEAGGKVIINTISYRAGGGKGFMSKLAANNGGTYKDIK